SQTEEVHFLQLSIVPAKTGIAPGYEHNTFARRAKQGRIRAGASPDGRDGSVTRHADALVHAGVFAEGETFELELPRGRHAWAHVARGKVRLNGRELRAGDGAAISEEPRIRVEGIDDGELLVFDLA